MASVGHLAVGLCLGRYLLPAASAKKTWLGMGLMAALALLPDADVIAFLLRIPYSAPWGHRGASHSLALGAATGLLCGALLSPLWPSRIRTTLAATLAIVSHGLLDTLTDGGLGVALLWPYSLTRYFAPLRPIPVAPIGLALLTKPGLAVLVTETFYFLPLLVLSLWPHRRKPSD
jgi:inner membrane protein